MHLVRIFVLLLPVALWGSVALAQDSQDAQELLEQFNTAYSAAVAADEAGDLQAALPQWQKAFDAIDQFEESEEIVPFKEQVLFKLGETHRLLGRNAEEDNIRQEHYAKAADIFQTLLDRAVLAVYERDDILLQQGYLYSDQGKRLETQGKYQDALKRQQQALEAFQAVADQGRRDDVVARERSALAKTLKQLGRYQEALKASYDALQYFKDTGDTQEQRREQNALATIRLNQGHIAEAATTLEELLAAESGATDLIQASATFNLGICLQLLGEYQRSRQLLEQARDMAAGLDDAQLPLEIANSQGIVDYYLGLYQEALHSFDAAASSQDAQLRAKALLNAVAVAIASLQEQFDYQLFQQAELDAAESMALAQTMDDPRTSLAAVQNMGRLQFELASSPQDTQDLQGNKIDKPSRAQAYADALKYLNEALKTAERLKTQNASLYEYSDIASNIGDVTLSLASAGLNGLVNSSGLCPDAPLLQCSQAHYRLALANAESIQAMEQIWQAHLGLGRAWRKLGDPAKAAGHFRQAIEVIESMRSILAGAEAAGFLRNRSEPYTELIDLELEQWSQAPENSPQAQQHARTALEYLERSRLAALKGLFEQALPAEKQQQGRELAACDYQLARLRLDPKANAPAIQKLEHKRSELEQALTQDDRFLHKPALDLEAVQLAMDDSLAVLVWYYNEADIFVWHVTQGAVQLHKTSREDSSGAAMAFIPGAGGVDIIDQRVMGFGNAIAIKEARNILLDSYKRLFRDTGLKLDPQQHPRLAVVPYGALAKLPFAALITDKKSGRFLLQDFEVEYLYALGQMLLQPAEQSSSLFAVGNPAMPSYFGKEVPFVQKQDDAEAQRGQQTAQGGAQESNAVPDLSVLPYEEAAFIFRMLNPDEYASTVQPVRSSRAFGFDPLPDAGEEVSVIGGDYTDRGLGESKSTADDTVTESLLVQQLQQSPPQYVHLATHGKLLPKSPLDSFLVFSEDPSAPQGFRSGLFTVRQIRSELFGKLAGARLCTLSCCETALRGQGMGLELASLAAAFQSAGASVVVASLWEVPSKATSLLMQGFYTHLFNGMMVAEALRQAQLELAAEPEYANPFYWAAFIPIGVDPQHTERGGSQGQGVQEPDTTQNTEQS